MHARCWTTPAFDPGRDGDRALAVARRRRAGHRGVGAATCGSAPRRTCRHLHMTRELLAARRADRRRLGPGRYAVPMTPSGLRTVSQLLVACLENEGVEVVFGLPGEENLHLVDALADSPIRFVTTRDERGAAFMADTYGALTGPRGRLPGDPRARGAQPDPRDRERPARFPPARRDHGAGGARPRLQGVPPGRRPRVASTGPVTKWGDIVTLRDAAPEMVRKAFKQAQTERPGATFIVLPEDVAERETAATPLRVNVPRDPDPSDDQVHRAAHVLAEARHPVVLAGAGVARDGAMDELRRFSEVLRNPGRHDLPGQGRVPRRPRARARHDRVHGEGLRELRVRPRRRRRRRRLRPRGVLARAVEPRGATSGSSTCTGAWPRSTRTTGSRSGCRARSASRSPHSPTAPTIHPISGDVPPVKALLREELAHGAEDDAFPLVPARDRRRHPRRDRAGRHPAHRHRRREDVDGAALPHLRAEHLPDLERPGDDGVRASRARSRRSWCYPDRKVLAAMGDGAFLMSVAEIETAVREHVAITILVWVDGGYGLIGWKQDIHFGRRSAVVLREPRLRPARGLVRGDRSRDRRRRRAAARRSATVSPTMACTWSRARWTTRRTRGWSSGSASSSGRCDDGGRRPACPAGPPQHRPAGVGARRRADRLLGPPDHRRAGGRGDRPGTTGPRGSSGRPRSQRARAAPP